MTITSKIKTAALTLGLAASALTLVTAPSAFAVEQRLGGVVGCKASGKKQETAAVIGALLGAAAGSNLAKNDQGTGTAIGAVIGAGAGSYVGCSMQKSEAANNAGGAYKAYGVNFATTVDAQPVTKIKGKYVARSNLNLRASASTRGEKVGGVEAGQTFQALGRTRDGRWILVGQDGVGVGYVSSAYVYRA
ncbi:MULTISPECIES: SH3 domain-containing protein [unclassified Caulobacter]|uniref:SH3 domain-containing protein n=1 Tax=unclassified Caulobacter TaxID=2648921 RepID=UPI000D3485B1|nr:MULTISPECIES: SH3 domain-containing protein [unclassified Caulobacter]PTS88584.1 peptide-binding protein [Caulobacter sp. HMWF009]PTT05448.1 peptide-binding protein [Caulobacter sp. HMWF025]